MEKTVKHATEQLPEVHKAIFYCPLFSFTLYNALTHPLEHLSQTEKPELCNHPATSELIVGIIKNKKNILNKGG